MTADDRRPDDREGLATGGRTAVIRWTRNRDWTAVTITGVTTRPRGQRPCAPYRTAIAPYYRGGQPPTISAAAFGMHRADRKFVVVSPAAGAGDLELYRLSTPTVRIGGGVSLLLCGTTCTTRGQAGSKRLCRGRTRPPMPVLPPAAAPPMPVVDPPADAGAPSPPPERRRRAT